MIAKVRSRPLTHDSVITPCGSAAIRVIHQPPDLRRGPWSRSCLGNARPNNGVISALLRGIRNAPGWLMWEILTWQVKAMAVISGIAEMVSGAFLSSQSCHLKEERLSRCHSCACFHLGAGAAQFRLTLQPHRLPRRAGAVGDRDGPNYCVPRGGYFQLSPGSSNFERNDRLDIQRHLVLLTDHFHQQMPVIIQKINYLFFSFWELGKGCKVTQTMPLLGYRHRS